MKRVILLGLMAMLFFAVSCENELSVPQGSDGLSYVSFTLKAPVIATRAESSAMQLQYAVYNEEGSEIEELRVTDGVVEEGRANVTLQLMAGKSYSVIFWAAAEGAPYAIDFENKKMTVDYASASTYDQHGDAFYAFTEFTVGSQPDAVTLSRPFAQINLGTGDYAAALAMGYQPESASVTIVNVPTVLSLVDGSVSEPVDVTYNAPETFSYTVDVFPVEGYDYLTKNYILVGSTKGVVDFEFAYTFAGEDHVRTIGSVPVQRNYRTNIFGNIFTTAVSLNISLDEEYTGDEEEDLSIVKIQSLQDFKDALTAKSPEVRFVDDVSHTGAKITDDIEIDLNDQTFTATNGVIELSANADVVLKNGTYNVNASSGYFDLRPTSEDGCSLFAEDVTFTNSYKKRQSTGKTNGTNNRTGDLLKSYPCVAGNIKIKVHFKNCTFDNTLISFGGSSDKFSDLDVTFEDCTFNALTASKIIDIGGYTTGTLKLDGCTFNLTCTSSSACAVYVSTFSNCTVRVEATDNTLNAVIAEKYTYDPEKGETDDDSIYFPYPPKNIKFISYSVNNNCSVVETNTTTTGIAVGASN